MESVVSESAENYCESSQYGSVCIGLPREVWIAILKFLAFKSQWSLRRVSRDWQAMMYEVVVSIPRYASQLLSDSVVSRFCSLRHLAIFDAKYITDAGISGLLTLTSLDLCHPWGPNMVTDAALSRLTNLTFLQLGNNEAITQASVSCLVNLTHLDLKTNSTYLGDGLSCLTKLKILNLEDAFVTNEALSQLSTLTTLALGNNVIIRDNCLSHLVFPNLTSLDLSCNRYITDRALVALTGLSSLELASNRVITDFGLSALTNLKSLGLYSNGRITYFGIAKLLNLTTLDLREIGTNTITNAGLERLTNITRLRFTRNRSININELPAYMNAIASTSHLDY